MNPLPKPSHINAPELPRCLAAREPRGARQARQYFYARWRMGAAWATWRVLKHGGLT